MTTTFIPHRWKYDVFVSLDNTKVLKKVESNEAKVLLNLTTTPDFSKITSLEVLDLEGCVNMVTVHPSIILLRDSLQVLNLLGCSNVNQLPETFWSRCWTSISGFIWKQQHPQRSVPLEGLHMLKSLKELNLQGNNFTSLPGSLSQLSNLQKLILDGCKKLEVLPELPHSLYDLHASDCTSLCSITGSNPIMRTRSTYLNNCPKLFENLAIDSQVSISETECRDSSVTSQGSTSRFSSFLRYAHNRCGLFRLAGSSIQNMDIYYHGNSIPKWFTNKSMGNQVKVELPLDWRFSKFRGYGICVFFKRKKPSTYFGYDVNNFDGDYLGSCNPYYYGQYFEGKPIRIDESDMIWLHYTTSGTWRLKEAKNFVTFCFFENEGIEVKEMGVRVVCDEDLDEEAEVSMFQDIPTLSEHGGAWCFGNYGQIDWTW